MNPLLLLLDDLEAKAKAAEEDGSLTLRIPTWITAGDGRDYLHALHESMPALVTALREAEEAMSMGAFHHNCCPWLNGKECYCAREKVDKWLAKYGKGNP